VRVLAIQLDGKIPNLAVARIIAHHKQRGDEVAFHFGRLRQAKLEAPERVYVSLIFESSKPFAEDVRRIYPNVIIGGTGWDKAVTLEQHGISSDTRPDYSHWPRFRQSIGFTQRGCRLRCSFCVVPQKEGAVREVSTVRDIWRGEPWPREVLLLDNDFFGQPNWQARVNEIREDGFKVSFNQGINARFLDDETAAAIASVQYRDDAMKVKRIYTAWDSLKDEERLFAGLEKLVKYGVPRSAIMVYMLIGFWPGETAHARNYRRQRLRDFGAMPYPMPYTRTDELVGFQRWVITHYDQKIPWPEWEAAGYQPYRLKWKPEPSSVLTFD
jgi:hypothetical protein